MKEIITQNKYKIVTVARPKEREVNPVIEGRAPVLAYCQDLELIIVMTAAQQELACFFLWIIFYVYSNLAN